MLEGKVCIGLHLVHVSSHDCAQPAWVPGQVTLASESVGLLGREEWPIRGLLRSFGS